MEKGIWDIANNVKKNNLRIMSYLGEEKVKGKGYCLKNNSLEQTIWR